MLEEVKAKIKTGEINEAMAIAFSQAIKLEIVTCISEGEKILSSTRLRTLIDLLNNEIDYQISEDLINNNSYNKFKQIHHSQVEQGNERIIKNVESLQKMFSVLNQTLSDLPKN